MTILLTFLLFPNVIGTLSYILVLTKASPTFNALQTAPLWATHAFGILVMLNVVLIVNLFRWRKWAFFGFCGSVAAALLVSALIGTELRILVLGTLGPVVLYVLLRPQWHLLT